MKFFENNFLKNFENVYFIDIHDRIYPPYYSQDEAKNANGGVWPTDFSKIKLRPGKL